MRGVEKREADRKAQINGFLSQRHPKLNAEPSKKSKPKAEAVIRLQSLFIEVKNIRFCGTRALPENKEISGSRFYISIVWAFWQLLTSHVFQNSSFFFFFATA